MTCGVCVVVACSLWTHLILRVLCVYSSRHSVLVRDKTYVTDYVQAFDFTSESDVWLWITSNVVRGAPVYVVVAQVMAPRARVCVGQVRRAPLEGVDQQWHRANSNQEQPREGIEHNDRNHAHAEDMMRDFLFVSCFPVALLARGSNRKQKSFERPPSIASRFGQRSFKTHTHTHRDERKVRYCLPRWRWGCPALS